ncbi:D-alanyl-D-alanine carboxypeptidase [Micromonospora pallida]|uniref:D-alanyl-D-alanine carboxypeptidase n=1 Tax=Micromonospora pallida TaxID=145854 RepID=A0A1C6RRA3_9ACTN|nr:M15 family metallopeptidase [Micromonospora pallida]SCL19695.1 D-alanyl-D-alanine carboxypeptidase [Micromonospora pallida]
MSLAATRPPARRAVPLVVVLVLAACHRPAPPPPPSPPSPTAPAFVSEIRPVTEADVARSWRPGCPVGPDRLRLVRLNHWDFAGQPRVGALVVHEAVAAEVVTAFDTLFRQRFPIRQIRPVDDYAGDDAASMAADNTSGFNCRRAVTEGAASWSTHAYGRAIDVNPVENPYLFGGQVLPPAGAAYVDRGAYRPGMAVPDGVLVRAFAAVGWSWGGVWANPDYQHFTTGR